MDKPDQKQPTGKLNLDSLSMRFKIQTNWHVITGAPCSGKTTVIDLLASHGYQTVTEVGRKYIEGELAKGRSLEEIRANDRELAPILQKLQVESEDKLLHDDTLFLDRALPDCLGFSRLLGLDPNEILPECFHHRYASVFILDLLPYHKDSVRNEDDATSKLLDQWIFQDYCSLGYDVVRVPILSPQDRMTFIMSRVASK